MTFTDILEEKTYSCLAQVSIFLKLSTTNAESFLKCYLKIRLYFATMVAITKFLQKKGELQELSCSMRCWFLLSLQLRLPWDFMMRRTVEDWHLADRNGKNLAVCFSWHLGSIKRLLNKCDISLRKIMKNKYSRQVKSTKKNNSSKQTKKCLKCKDYMKPLLCRKARKKSRQKKKDSLMLHLIHMMKGKNFKEKKCLNLCQWWQISLKYNRRKLKRNSTKKKTGHFHKI